MELKLGVHAGFCSGVRRAVKIAEEAGRESLLSGKPVYTYGYLIHNRDVLDRLRDLNVTPVESVDQLGEGDTLIIRSHGVSPDVIDSCRERGVNIIDATCSYVKRMHELVEDASRTMPVVIVGDKDHPEVVGTVGWCEGKAMVVGTASEAAELPRMDKAAVVAQTTISKEMFGEATAALRSRADELIIYDTICGATAARQGEAETIASWADVMIVVGGKESSNTKHLALSCRRFAKRVYHVERASDLVRDGELIKLIGKSGVRVGVVSGASTPDWIISEVVEAIRKPVKPIEAVRAIE